MEISEPDRDDILDELDFLAERLKAIKWKLENPDKPVMLLQETGLLIPPRNEN